MLGWPAGGMTVARRSWNPPGGAVKDSCFCKCKCDPLPQPPGGAVKDLFTC